MSRKTQIRQTKAANKEKGYKLTYDTKHIHDLLKALNTLFS